MICIFKIPQYQCHLNNVRNATLFERGLFSLLHCGEDTAVCVTERESSETEAVELQPQIRKSWDSMENANKKRK